jgi:hypothetical protein
MLCKRNLQGMANKLKPDACGLLPICDC